MSLSPLSMQLKPSCLQALESGWQETFLIDALQNRSYTKSEFFQATVACLQRLNHANLQAGDSLLVVMENSSAMAVLFFACMLGRITFIPFDPGKGAKDFEDILELVNAKAYLTTKSGFEYPGLHLEPADFMELRITHHDNIKAYVLDQLTSTLEGGGDDQISLITFTSGSTGKPKGVCHSFLNLLQSAESLNACFGFNAKHRFYHNFPMSYMAGLLNSLVVPFVSGSQIVIGERFGVATIHSFWKPIIQSQANVLWFNPTMLSLLIKLDRSGEGVEYAHRNALIGLVATAPLSETLKNRFEEKYAVPLYQSYGLSETLFVSTNHPGATSPDSVGYLLAGAAVNFAKKADDNLDSEILIKVPWMFKGYLGSDTAGYFKDGFYRSGDLGQQKDSGALFITGRCKDIIIRGGINISPRRLEDFIASHEPIEECAIVGLPDTVLGEKLILAYVPRPNTDSSLEKLILAQVAEQFGADYKIDGFMRLDVLPTNNNGKLDKMALKALYASFGQR